MQDVKLEFPTYIHLLDGFIMYPPSTRALRARAQEGGRRDRGRRHDRRARDGARPTRPSRTSPSLLAERDVSRLPVLDGDELVGIVSKHDIVRAIAARAELTMTDDALGLGRDRPRRDRAQRSRARGAHAAGHALHGGREGRRLRSRRRAGRARGACGGRDRLGVATVDEARRAARRRASRRRSTLLSEPPDDRWPTILEHRLVPTLYTREFARRAGQRRARARHRGALPPEGRHRDEPHRRARRGCAALRRGARRVRRDSSSRAPSRTSRPPTSRATGTSTAQLERFHDALEGMRTEGVSTRASCTPRTARRRSCIPESHFDMVRCGIALYGLHPSASTRGRVDLRAGDVGEGARHAREAHRHGRGRVSYGLTWQAASPTDDRDAAARLRRRRAPRALEPHAGARRRRARCRRSGACAWTSSWSRCRAGSRRERGDEFVLVGAQGAERITMDELAELAGTINYEMACAFGMRLPRVYRLSGRPLARRVARPDCTGNCRQELLPHVCRIGSVCIVRCDTLLSDRCSRGLHVDEKVVEELQFHQQTVQSDDELAAAPDSREGDRDLRARARGEATGRRDRRRRAHARPRRSCRSAHDEASAEAGEARRSASRPRCERRWPRCGAKAEREAAALEETIAGARRREAVACVIDAVISV